MEKTRTNKKTIAIVAAVTCLALAAALGTYAWLTSAGSLTNNFTTAGINTPTTDPDNPGEEITKDATRVSGNLIETAWVDNSKLAPGTSVAKNPRVGLGAGSENAYVLLNVKNNTASSSAADTHTTYFTIDSSSWAPVEGTAKTVSGEPTHYLSGLFIYIGSSAQPVTTNGAMAADKDSDKWTTALFTQVTTPAETTAGDFASTADGNGPSIDVNYYISAEAADTKANPEGSKDAAITAAKTQFGYTN